MFGFKKKKKTETASHYSVSELGEIRYEIEHRFLPHNFFKEPEKLINALLQEDMLYNLYNDVLSKTKGGNPYQRNEFHVDALTFDTNNIIVSIELPVPQHSPLCYRIHLIIDRKNNNLAFYTIERGRTQGFLCYWDESIHGTIREIANPLWDEKERAFMKALEANIILDLYREMYQNK